jgi:Methane oxygenase PmoA
MQPQCRFRVAFVAGCVAAQLITTPGQEPSRVQVTRNDSAARVDIVIDGRPFTSYLYMSSLKKPALFPLRTAAGVLVTRGFPLEPRPRERVDHPHHIGLWFNHGDVNGLDFWNNSDAIAGERVEKMGTIGHRAIVRAKGGSDRGDLIVESEWKRPDGLVLLVERTHFVFRGASNVRSVDRLTTLTGATEPVIFRDSKEGALGLRVARELEQPAEEPEVFTDAAGKPSAVPVLDNTGVTGLYISSEGLKGEAVWGTRGRWMMLTGSVNGQHVTVGMLDHPANPGFPSYWHARGYGLFAVNPLGRKSYDDKQAELVFRLEPGKSVVFRHRVLVADRLMTAEDLNRAQKEFAAARLGQ